MSTAEKLAPTLAPGWYPGLSLEAYLAIPAMSASGLELFRRSPQHFRWEQLHPREPTDAMRLGTALHMALLEPHLFAGRYVALGQCEAVTGKGQRCTNQASYYRGGAAYCGVRGHDPEGGAPNTVEVIDAGWLDRVEGMKAAILGHPQASQFFRGRGQSEVTGVWLDEATGVPCKLRLDRDIARAVVHADVKSCRDASAEAFTRQCGKMGYVRKAAWYRRGMAALGREARGSVLVAIESEAPHGCATYCLDEFDIAGFAPQIDRVLKQYAECLAADRWPGYPTDVTPLKLMPWDEPRSTSADFDYEDEE